VLVFVLLLCLISDHEAWASRHVRRRRSRQQRRAAYHRVRVRFRQNEGHRNDTDGGADVRAAVDSKPAQWRL
jgi:hypothetical protein